MILLTSPSSVMNNALRIFKAHNLPLPDSEASFRKTYQDCLVIEQPHCFWLRTQGMSFYDTLDEKMTDEKRRKFVDLYSVDTTPLDDLAQASVIKSSNSKRDVLVDKLKSAYEFLQRRSPSHFKIFELIIEGIFVDASDVAAGGTTSDAVGVIWANPHPKFETPDLAEFLVHELTHNCMFLDEWIHPHYDYSIMEDRSTWALSAILDRMRPIDKVVHSLVVAAEIVLLRKDLIGEPSDPKAHPPTAQIVSSIETTIRDLHRVHKETQVLTDRTLELVEIAHQKTLSVGIAAQ